MSISTAINEFLNNREELEAAIISSTKASWGGGRYVVEFFPDSTYRVLAGITIGNRYHSPGLIVSIPELSEDEWDGTEEGEAYFENAINEFLNITLEMKDIINQE